MNLQPTSTSITVQQNFVHQTKGLVHKVGNITLDPTKWGAGTVVKAGTVVSVGQGGNTKAEPYDKAAATKGVVYVTTTDVKVDGVNNVNVGALEAGYLKRSRITGVAQADEATFMADSQYRFKLR